MGLFVLSRVRERLGRVGFHFGPGLVRLSVTLNENEGKKYQIYINTVNVLVTYAACTTRGPPSLYNFNLFGVQKNIKLVSILPYHYITTAWISDSVFQLDL
jgi:hypothetical protein